MRPLLKEAVIRALLKKKPNLDPKDLGNYRPVSNLPFWGTVIEWVVAKELYCFLDDADCLVPVEPGFWLGCGAETTLVALVDDLRRDSN